ncbi:MAG: thiamine phosphate synthase [Alphaproteobacteria bacterium]|uniref:thiamine phosphate synthase n=1 Tax=Pacificispira sp. TaxID=2888761 RepID=UPI0032F19AC3
MTDRVVPQLYLVSPPRFEPAGFADSVAAALDGGPVACVQLWMPDADDNEVRRAVKAVYKVVQNANTAFLLNGHVKLAAFMECDGVHLDGADPAAIRAAKKMLGDEAIVGVSCGTSRHASMEAGEAGADYVSFGPVFDTATKGLPADPNALDTLEWWAEMMEVPCVAVGGLTPDNIYPVVETRCEFICAVSSVWDHPDGPAAAVGAFHDALSRIEAAK